MIIKTLALLNTSTYKELKRDPTANIERKICSKLSGFKKAGILSQTLHNCLRPSATVCPKFYGLPKIHKPNVPLLKTYCGVHRFANVCPG